VASDLDEARPLDDDGTGDLRIRQKGGGEEEMAMSLSTTIADNSKRAFMLKINNPSVPWQQSIALTTCESTSKITNIPPPHNPLPPPKKKKKS